MGWRGVLRDIQAASRRAERDAYRQRRALEHRLQQAGRMDEFERVQYEVEEYENQLALLGSIHKECGVHWDWQTILASPPPARRASADTYESGAKRALARYKPSLLDRLFGRTASKREALERRIHDARRRDQEDSRQAAADLQAATTDWQNSRLFAHRILSGDLSAYAEAIRETRPFADIDSLGSSLQFEIPNAHLIQA